MVKSKKELAEKYGETWVGENISWAAAQSGFLEGWDTCINMLKKYAEHENIEFYFLESFIRSTD